jgi:hypothetical protein
LLLPQQPPDDLVTMAMAKATSAQVQLPVTIRITSGRTIRKIHPEEESSL